MYGREFSGDPSRVGMSLSQPTAICAPQFIVAGLCRNAEHLVGVGGDGTVLHPVENTGYKRCNACVRTSIARLFVDLLQQLARSLRDTGVIVLRCTALEGDHTTASHRAEIAVREAVALLRAVRL